jgi:pyruvate ferredoxin oxidoreductase alpha subunit
MSLRDCGWIQLYARDNQEAADLHILGFRLAEQLSIPVMVCMDGFVLTHAFEEVDVAEQGLVDAYLPPFRPRQVLDPAAPVTIGAMVGPEAFTEVRYLAHENHLRALEAIPRLAEEFAAVFGRACAGLISPYRSADAELVVVALGSVLGTVAEVIDDLRDNGVRVGALGITTFRPFPAAAVRDALRDGQRVVALERAFSPGGGGIVTQDLRAALSDRDCPISTVVAGLGGRAVTRPSLRRMLVEATAGSLQPLAFLDLDRELLGRVSGGRVSGGAA